MQMLAHQFARVGSDFAKAQRRALNAAGHDANVFGFCGHIRSILISGCANLWITCASLWIQLSGNAFGNEVAVAARPAGIRVGFAIPGIAQLEPVDRPRDPAAEFRVERVEESLPADAVVVARQSSPVFVP